MRSSASLIAILLLAAVTPSWAQDTRSDDQANPDELPPPTAAPPPPPGQTADTAVGRAGERRTREQIDGVQPMARINSRIQNRVQARIRSRIDRYYDPRANAASPFEVAGEATRRASQRQTR